MLQIVYTFYFQNFQFFITNSNMYITQFFYGPGRVKLNYHIFFSLIGNEDALSVYELHIAVKDHCFGFGREDRLVGVAVMQLKDVEDQVSWSKKIFQ